MKYFTLLIASALCIGSFVSPVQAGRFYGPKAGNVKIVRYTPLMRVSRRTLENNVRSTWRHLNSTTKGF